MRVLAISTGEWIQWAVANWIGIFSMMAMLAFILLLLVMALAPDPQPDGRQPEHPGRDAQRTRSSTPERERV